MKQTLTSRILIAGVALALMFTASVGEAKVDVPTKVMLRSSVIEDVYGRPIDDGILTATIKPSGAFSFIKVPAGTYELLLVGTQEYFTAKAAETGNTITLDFDWAPLSSMNKNLISKSSIRHNPMASGGSGADSSQAIVTSRSNIKHQSCPISPSNVTSADVRGRTVHSAVLLGNIIVTGDSSPNGKVTNVALAKGSR